MVDDGKGSWREIEESDADKAYKVDMGGWTGVLECEELHMIPFHQRSYGVFKRLYLGICLL